VFELDPAETIPNGITRVLNDAFDDAGSRLDAMGSADPVDIEQAVHKFRKRCKELRAVALLVRPALGPAFRSFNHLVRDASAELSASRDAHVMLKTIDSLTVATDHSANFAAIRDRQLAVAEAATTALQRGDEHQDRARRLVAAARNEANVWDLPDSTAPIADGLERTYRRGRRALGTAERLPTDDHMHEWRKSVKNLWYKSRLLVAADRTAMTALDEDLHAVGDLVGEDHDLAVLIERVEHVEGGLEVCELARARQHALRKKALRLGKHIYSEAPADFADQIVSGWSRSARAVLASTLEGGTTGRSELPPSGRRE
jgi:CHAD domain-containing protein